MTKEELIALVQRELSARDEREKQCESGIVLALQFERDALLVRAQKAEARYSKLHFAVEQFRKAIGYDEWRDKVSAVYATWPEEQSPYHLGTLSFKVLFSELAKIDSLQPEPTFGIGDTPEEALAFAREATGCPPEPIQGAADMQEAAKAKTASPCCVEKESAAPGHVEWPVGVTLLGTWPDNETEYRVVVSGPMSKRVEFLYGTQWRPSIMAKDPSFVAWRNQRAKDLGFWREDVAETSPASENTPPEPPSTPGHAEWPVGIVELGEYLPGLIYRVRDGQIENANDMRTWRPLAWQIDGCQCAECAKNKLWVRQRAKDLGFWRDDVTAPSPASEDAPPDPPTTSEQPAEPAIERLLKSRSGGGQSFGLFRDAILELDARLDRLEADRDKQQEAVRKIERQYDQGKYFGYTMSALLRLLGGEKL